MLDQKSFQQTQQYMISLHILEHYKKDITHLALFQPTTPFRNIDEISNAIDVFKNKILNQFFQLMRLLIIQVDTIMKGNLIYSRKAFHKNGGKAVFTESLFN